MGTFFTLVGEIGLALHELYEALVLVMGDAPYEEYIPASEELHLLRKEDPAVYLMAWYVMNCPSLMRTMSSSEGFIPFVQRLESLSWSYYYMYFVQKSILSRSNY